MKKRNRIRVASFMLATIAALGTFGLTENNKRKQYEQIIAISQQRSLSELSRYMDNIELSLTKGMYANTPPMISSLATMLWRDATGAKTSLSQLGTGETPLENTYKFLSQVGEFTMALNKKVADKQEITDEEKASLNRLLSFASTLSEELAYLQTLVENNNLDFEKIKSSVKNDVNNAGNTSFVDTMKDQEQTLTDYPTLLYDGPFSDNIDKKESILIKNSSEVSLDKATELAAQFSGMDKSQVSHINDEGGKIPSYIFSAGDYNISITKNGGFLSYMLDGAFAGEEKLSPEDAVLKAKEFLNANGFPDMKESYYAKNDGVCLVNFAYFKDNITYYPDLVKVGVALDTGRIVSVEARGFIMNHQERKPVEPAFSIELGQNKVSSNLQIQKSALVVIPKDNGDERYAYEYHCIDEKGQEVLVYIDVKTGDEADILLLMYTDGGVLTK